MSNENIVGSTKIMERFTRETLEVAKKELQVYVKAIGAVLKGESFESVIKKFDIDEELFSYLVEETKYSERIPTAKKSSFEKGMNRDWPESLYCAIFNEESFTDLPDDVEDTLASLMENMSDRDRRIIIRIFRDKERLVNIAKDLDVSGTRISQIRNAFLISMREPLTMNYLVKGEKALQLEEEQKKAKSRMHRDEFRESSLWKLGFTPKAVISLMSCGIKDGGDLLDNAEAVLKRWPGMVDSTFSEIESLFNFETEETSTCTG